MNEHDTSTIKLPSLISIESEMGLITTYIARGADATESTRQEERILGISDAI